MKSLFLAFVLSICLIPQSFAQTDEQYTDALYEMFKVSGAEESYKTVIKTMFNFYKNSEGFNQVDEEIWDELEKEMLKTSIKDLAEMLTPVYKKYLSIDDLKAVVAFYKTPAGKKMAKYQPEITEQSMEIGGAWGEKIGEKIIEKIEKKYR